MNGQRESLDHVSPVENQGDHPEFLRWLLVGGASTTKTMGTSREGGGGSRDCEVET